MAGPFDLLANKRRSTEEQAGLDSLLNRTPAPAPTYAETAPAPKGMGDEELALRSAPTPALQFGGGVEQLKAMSKNAIAAAAQAASNAGAGPGAAEFGRGMRTSAQQDEAEAAQMFEASGAPMSLKDVDGFGSAASYIGAGVTRNAPQIGAMIAGRGMLGKAGVPAAAVGMNVGDIYGEGQNEIDTMVKAGQLDPQREKEMRDQVLINSGVGGLIAGALDTIGFSAMFPGAKALAAQSVARSLPRAVLNAAGKEGGTEIVQEYVALVANKLALEKPEAMGLTEDDMWRLTDAGILGAAGGATFGLPGNLAGQAGAVADKAVDAGAGLYKRARGAAETAADLPGTVAAAAPGVGQKGADWVNAIMSGDVPSIKAGVSAAGDALMQAPGVATIAKEGGDFIKGLRVPPRAQAAWDKYEPQVKQGWEQFKTAFADKIDTGNIESAYDYYKKTLAVTMPTIGKVDPAAAGAAMGETITAFNEWVGRNEPVFRSIVGAAVNTAKDVAPIVAAQAKSNIGAAVNTAKDVAPIVGQAVSDAAAPVISGARTIAQGVAENAPIAASVAKTAAGGMYEILDKYGITPGKEFAKGVDDRIKEELRDMDPPSDEEVEASANALLEQLRAARGTTKQSSIPMRSNGAKIIRSTLLDMVPRMDKNTADQYARSLDEMLNDRARTEQHLNTPEGREQIGQLFNLTPSEFLARLYVDLREFGQDSDTQKAAFTPGDETYATDSTVGVQQETDLADKTAGTIAQENGADIDYAPDDDVDFSFGNADTDTSVDAPRGDEVELDPKHYEEAMAQLYNEAGKQIGFTRAGPPELTFLKKALYKPGDKIKMKDGKVIDRKSAKGGQQWVIGTKTVEGEAPQTFNRQINLADLGIFASKDVKAGTGKKDRNFQEGFGKLFGETFVDNTADGKRVEYTFQPATMRDEGPVPIDPAAWDKWLRPDSKITKDGRTWGAATEEARDKARRQPITSPSALAASKRLIDDMVKNELSEFRIDNARTSAYKSAGIQAVSELYNLFPADPKDKADASVRETFQATRDAIAADTASPAPVEAIWAFLNRKDVQPAEWDDYVARFEAAGRANDFAAVRTGRPLVNPAMRESWEQLSQIPAGDVLVAVQLLPKEVLDVARDAMLKKLDEIEEKRLGPPAPELDEAMSRPETLEEEGPVTEDLGGQFIEYKPTAQDAERGSAFAAARDNLRAKIKKYGRKTPQAKALKSAMNAINDPRTSIDELRAMAASDLTGSTAAAIVRASRDRMESMLPEFENDRPEDISQEQLDLRQPVGAMEQQTPQVGKGSPSTGDLVQALRPQRPTTVAPTLEQGEGGLDQPAPTQRDMFGQPPRKPQPEPARPLANRDILPPDLTAAIDKLPREKQKEILARAREIYERDMPLQEIYDDPTLKQILANGGEPGKSVVRKTREAGKAGPEVSAQGPKDRSGTVKRSDYTGERRKYNIVERDGQWTFTDDVSGEEIEVGPGEDDVTGRYFTREAAQRAADADRSVKRADYEGETTGNASIDPETQEVLRQRIRQIAGDTKVVFKEGTTGGEFDWADQVITLALTDALPLGTEYHEALHAVFKDIADNDKRTLYRGLNTPFVKRQLRELLKDSPESLKKIDNDAEELAAYAFQFWKLGKLKLGPDTLNWMEKLQKLFTRALEYLKDEPSFEKLMTNISNGYYRNGGPSPLELAIARNSRGAVRQVMADTTRGLLTVYDKLLGTNDDRLRETGNGALGKIVRLLYTQVGEKTETRGLAQEIPVMTARWMNEMAKVMGNDAAQTMRTLEAMAMGDESGEHAKQFRSYLNKIHNYLKDAGVDVGYMKNYVPLQWSGDKIRANEGAFMAMLARHQVQIDKLNESLKKTGAGKLTIESITELMMNRNLKDAVPTGDLFDADTGVPTAHHVEDRVFSFLSNADRRPFVEDNLIGTMGQYVKQVVKHAEYARRFGDDGKLYKQLLEEAKATGATQAQLDLVRDSKDAIFGAKYNRMDPKWRKILGGVQTYQNLRVLGLALFSSVADPLAIGVRTGDFGEAWGAFKFAVKNIVNMKETDLKLLADDIGAVNELGTIDSLMSLYGGFEVEGNMKRANDLLFKLNGLDGLTRALRVYAVGAGLRFIQRADDRALAELGLKRADLKTMSGGELAVRSSQFRELGMTPEQATKAALKMQTALNRFVDESVLRPNAMERPNWANDPMFSLLFHLKQFIFSFHKIVSKKVMHEMEEGNLNAQMALSAAAFIPLMGASGFVKDMIQFAGDVPADRDFMHYLGVGVNRSGFMGPSVLLTDPAADLMKGMSPLGGAVGPTGSQALEGVQAIANPTRFGAWIEAAFPFSSIFKRWNN